MGLVLFGTSPRGRFAISQKNRVASSNRTRQRRHAGQARLRERCRPTRTRGVSPPYRPFTSAAARPHRPTVCWASAVEATPSAPTAIGSQLHLAGSAGRGQTRFPSCPPPVIDRPLPQTSTKTVRVPGTRPVFAVIPSPHAARPPGRDASEHAPLNHKTGTYRVPAQPSERNARRVFRRRHRRGYQPRRERGSHCPARPSPAPAAST